MTIRRGKGSHQAWCGEERSGSNTPGSRTGVVPYRKSLSLMDIGHRGLSF